MILVTGGAGFIGSHTCVELINAGYEVVVVDNFCNSDPSVLDRIKKITGHACSIEQVDLRDKEKLDAVFSKYSIEAVIHFAGLKAVGESVEKPLLYYDNNVTGSLVLFELMAKHNIHTLVFSSSATVYGDPHTVPIKEDFPLQTTNPYGRSKHMIEDILRDISSSFGAWRIALLRYFNPVGAHESGLIGEKPKGIPNNLMPYISQVAAKQRKALSIFGNDYPTIDGTGVRDYIHVVDLAKAHVKALQKLQETQGVVTYNLGRGHGYSVLQVIKAFEQATDQTIPYTIVPRRPGDVAACYADTSLAERELKWKAEKDINMICVDAWRWQSMAD